jgi:hypothetical protein
MKGFGGWVTWIQQVTVEQTTESLSKILFRNLHVAKGLRLNCFAVPAPRDDRDNANAPLAATERRTERRNSIEKVAC